MGSELAKYEYTDVEALSTRVAKSALVPEAYRNRPDDVLVAMLMGRDLGVAPMQALLCIDVVEGRAAPRSRLRQTLAMRHPACEYFVLVESTTKAATYEAKRRGAPQVRLTYTIEQAASAGLTRKANWQKHPAEMLRARCAGQLADAVFPDAVLGLPPEDGLDLEAEAAGVPQVEVDVTPPVVEAPAPPASRTAALKAKLGVQSPAVVDGEVVEAKATVPPPAPAPEKSRRMKYVDAPPVAPPPEAMPVMHPVVPPASPAPAPEVKRTSWERALDLGKLYGKAEADVKAALKSAGVKRPSEVTEAHLDALRAQWDVPAREPGSDDGDVF